MNYTTIEQSKKLVELGLNPETADMHYNVYADGSFDNYPIGRSWHRFYNKDDIPCWSLGALIQMLPLNIKTGDSFLDEYVIEFKLNSGYMVAYCIDQSHHPIVFTEKHETLIEACVEMVVWLIENGYINTEKK